MSTKTSPVTAPDYALYREVDAADVMTNVVKKHGCNAAMFTDVHIQVIPATGINPNVAVWWWSEEANAFIQEHTPITKSGVGAGVPYEFSIQPKGRIFFVQVTTTTGALKIAVSGFEQTQFS
jgi:hypothetical protein